MIEQLRICKIVRSRYVRVLIGCCDPGLENLLALCQHKVAKPSDSRERGPGPIVRSDKRNPPVRILDRNIGAALGEMIIS
jgi:hypothetical protein